MTHVTHLQALEAAGVIQRYVALTQPQALGLGLNVPDVQKILRHFNVDATGKGDVVRSRLDALLTRIILQQDPIMQQWIKEEESEDCVLEYCPRWTP